MARTGVTQNDIDTAADALLLAGERPTVERIRAALGRGSPNTVGRLLDAWWVQLGQRLAAKQRQVAVVDAPEEVSELASGLWRTALSVARNVVEQDVTTTRQQLAAAAVTLEADRRSLGEAREAMEIEQTRLQAALDHAQARNEDLVQQLQAIDAQKTRAETQADAATAARDAIAQQLEQARTSAATAAEHTAQERAALIAHSQAVEERAAQNVDRLRQDLKTAKQDTQAHEKEFKTRIAALESALRSVQKETADARKAEAVASARADALGVQFANLPAALQAALGPKTTVRRSSQQPKTNSGKKRPSKRVTSTS